MIEQGHDPFEQIKCTVRASATKVVFDARLTEHGATVLLMDAKRIHELRQATHAALDAHLDAAEIAGAVFLKTQGGVVAQSRN
jgi:hypothetical protein